MQNLVSIDGPLTIQWRDYYSVGDATLDAQHQTIISLINWLYEIIWGGNDRSAVTPVIRRLHEYTHSHFKDEEKMMLAAGFPGLADHKVIHEKLVSDTDDLLFRSLQDDGPDSREVLQYLKRWWINHITGDDKQYVICLRESRRKSSGLMSVDRELSVLMTSLIENEQRIGHYYEIMAECLPEHRETWDILRRQEHSHTEAMQQIGRFVEEMPALFAVGKFSPRAAQIMAREIDGMIEKIQKGTVHPGYAVSFAKDVEQSLLEGHLAEAIKTDVLEVKNILARLSQETTSHRLLLHSIAI